MITFQNGEFNYSSAEWFDWLSMGLNIATLIFTYNIAHRIYSKEKKDRNIDEKKAIEIEYELLKLNLSLLNTEIKKQILGLTTYLDGSSKYLGYNSLMQIKFIDGISLVNIYKQIGVENTEEINKINELIANLYSLNDFKENLRYELQNYNNRVTSNEKNLFKYRDLLYSFYFKLANERKISGDNSSYKFSPNDKFMIQYSDLIKVVQTNPLIFDKNELINRDLFIEKFIRPLMALSVDFILIEKEAIKVNSKANIVFEAYSNLTTFETQHEKMIGELKLQLEKVQKLIEATIN